MRELSESEERSEENALVVPLGSEENALVVPSWF
jgi:hypothetical protein